MIRTPHRHKSSKTTGQIRRIRILDIVVSRWGELSLSLIALSLAGRVLVIAVCRILSTAPSRGYSVKAHAAGRRQSTETCPGVKATKAEVVTIDVADMNTLQLQQEVLALRERIGRLVALLRLVMVLLKIAGFSLANVRIREQAEKHKLLRAIERARSVLPLRIVLGVLRLSHSRYHSWKREEECRLEDIFPTRRFVARRRMRCTLVLGRAFPSSWQPLGRRHVRHAWRPIERARVRHVSR